MRGWILAAVLVGTSAQAEVVVTFRDGAPKDRFTITNEAACATGPVQVVIDLAPSPAGLIFDITGGGAGVEVFQPFEVTAGAEALTAVSALADGDQSLTLDLRDIAQGADIAFTIDLDDTGGGREITVSGAEIEGAMVRILSDMAVSEGVFDASGMARVAVPGCAA